MKDEMGRVSSEEFAGLNPKLYQISVCNSNEYEKGTGVNKNVATKISHIECKHV